MRKNFLAIVFLLGIYPLFAQTKFGVKAGGLLSNFAYEGVGLSSPGTQGDAKLSYLVGVAAAFPISDRLSLQTDLLYSREGAQTGFVTIMNETSRTSDHLHYLSVAPLLCYRVINKLHISVGPEVSYLIGAYQRSELLGSTSTFLSYRPLDLAVNFDVQYHLLEKWSVGLRYNLGVYDVTKRFEVISFDDMPIVIDSNVYNRSVQLSLYYWLR